MFADRISARNASNSLFKPTSAETAYAEVNGTPGPDLLFGVEGGGRFARVGSLIHAGDGGDTVFAGGGHDIVWGDGGTDWLYGQGGNDDLHGGADNDWLFGQDGNDSIFGDDGADLIMGGRGIDNLSGGGGADTFRWNGNGETGFSAASGMDVIEDFNPYEGDRIDLSALVDRGPLATPLDGLIFIGDFNPGNIFNTLFNNPGFGQVGYTQNGPQDFTIWINTSLDDTADYAISVRTTGVFAVPEFDVSWFVL